MQQKRNWIYQILICAAMAAVLVAGDFYFFWHQFEDRYPRPWSATYETFALMLILSIAFRRRGFYISVAVIALTAFLQMAHLSYFGTFLHPTKIYLFFTHSGEVFETLGSIGRMLVLPSLIFALTLALIWGVSKFQKQDNWNWKPMKWLLLLAVIYFPIRTYVTNGDFGKQPAVHNLAFSNFYSSFTYFLGRTLPFKLTHQNNEVYQAQYERQVINPQVNVIFILGESLRYQNMQLFGYPKPTTPGLMKLKDEVPMVYRKGISGGVCTDVSIPLFVNNYQSTNPMGAILSQERCLFKLAKENGFETHFYSAQAEGDLKHIVNYLCLPSIDHIQIGPGKSLMEDIDKHYYDDILLSYLDRVDFSKPNFLLLHQRGSHSPYNLRYPKESAAFPVDGNADVGSQMITHYDNSVAFTDKVVTEIVHRIRERSKFPTYIVFTSDHGQVLGENKSWGHNDLNDVVFKIPFVFMSMQKDAVVDQVNQWPEYVAHKDMSDLLVSLMGYKTPIEPAMQRKVFVMGYDLDGLEGGMWVQLGSKEIEGVQQDDLTNPAPASKTH
jgi:glucan phosphoethanolaminetransferase (alkaline phosphatase superfamily)